MEKIIQGGSAIGSYLISGIAFLTNASELIGVLSGLAGVGLTISLILINYAEYRSRMTDIKKKEAEALALEAEAANKLKKP